MQTNSSDKQLAIKSLVQYQRSAEMAWIFTKCLDPYGSCIRQYITFGVTLLVFIFCLVSIIETVRKQKHYNFQLIPLIVNALATFVLVVALAQYDQQDLYMILLVVEIYSYSLLTYSYGGLYLLGTKRISKKQFGKIRTVFVVYSLVFFAGLVVLVILQLKGIVKCTQNNGVGYLILSCVEVPIYVIAFIFIIRTKKHIEKIQQKAHENQQTQIKLLGDEDEYIKIRIRQANLMIGSFTFSLVLHLVIVIMSFQQETTCLDEKYIVSKTLYDVILFSLTDLATLVPHVFIPVILYIIPREVNEIGSCVVIVPNKVIRQQTNIDYTTSQYETDERIRRLTRQVSPAIKGNKNRFDSS